MRLFKVLNSKLEINSEFYNLVCSYYIDTGVMNGPITKLSRTTV